MAIANRSLLMDKLHGFRRDQAGGPGAAARHRGRLRPQRRVRRRPQRAVRRLQERELHRGLNVLPADAPVSFPHLWGMERTSWFQWGVNTNSVIERNIGQALGVGATMQPDKGYRSTVRLDNLHAMEELQYKLTSPAVARRAVRTDRSRARRARQENLRSHVRAVPRNLRQDRHAERISALRRSTSSAPIRARRSISNAR